MTCICKSPPQPPQPSGFRYNMILDHRCPQHGEKAQPKLWGRHKELELLVTPIQWDTLAVAIGEET